MQAISTCLWFDGKAEQAANFYVSIFKNAQIIETMRYGEAGPGPAGSVMLVRFTLDGREFSGLNGGPHYSFTPAISFMISCDTQDDIDYYWSRLCADGGKEVQCGWLTDQFGVSWQIVPARMSDYFNSPDKAASQRAFGAMMKMVKLDIAALERAYNNG